jgi:hypothetical protein
VTITLQALSLVEKVSSSLLHTMLEGGTNRVCACKMDVKSTWLPTWHRIGSCFMVTWTIFKNHFLEVGLTQNRETMALWTLTTIVLIYFIMCEDPLELKFIEVTFGWWHSHIRGTLHVRICDHTTWFWRCVGTGGLWTLSFGLSQFRSHGSWLVCEVALDSNPHKEHPWKNQEAPAKPTLQHTSITS